MNISMLNDKTQALTKIPALDGIPIKKNGKKEVLKDLIEGQTMSLPQIRKGSHTAR